MMVGWVKIGPGRLFQGFTLLLLILGLGNPGRGGTISGWADTVLSFSLEEQAFSLETSTSLELELSDVLTGYIQCRWAEGVLDTLKLKYNLYYSRSWRFSGYVRFKKGVFYKSELAGRYRNDHLQLELKGIAEAEGGPSLEGDISYETGDLSHELEFSLSGPGLSPEQVTWTYLFPLPKAWRGKAKLQWNVGEPAFSWEGKGDSPWGKLDLRGEGFRLQSLSLRREIEGSVPQEIVLSLDLSEGSAEVVDTFYYGKTRNWGYGFKFSTGIERFALEEFICSLFGPTWKSSADLIGRTISFRGSFPRGEDYTLFADLSLDEEGLGGDVGIEVYWADFTLDVYLYLSDWTLSEVETEVYLEF